MVERLPVQVAGQVVAGYPNHVLHGLPQPQIARDMRRNQNILILPQRIISRKRLGRSHVKRGSGDPPFIERLAQSSRVDRVPAACVDKVTSLLHPPQQSFVHQVLRLRGGRQDHGDDVPPATCQ